MAEQPPQNEGAPEIAFEGAPRSVEQPSPLRIWVAGDVMSSAQIRDAAADAESPAAGIASMLAPLTSLWADDFVIVNLETPVTARRRRAHEDAPAGARYRAVYLNAPPYLLDGLRQAGVDAVTLANNHALDQQSEGLRETIERAHGANLITLGAGEFPRHRRPLRFGTGSREVAVFNAYDALATPAADPGEMTLSLRDDALVEAIRTCTAPHIVVIAHVLGELVEQPDESWRGWTTELSVAGADAILLHGTHVPMRVETLQQENHATVIAWGLGNLLTDMGRMAGPRRREESKLTSPRTREGLVARIEVGECLHVDFLPVFETDDRFIRWHGDLPPGESSFWVRPLSACDPPLTLPEPWPNPWRDEYARWIGTRRDHLVGMAQLTQEPCGAGAGWLDSAAPAPPQGAR